MVGRQVACSSTELIVLIHEPPNGDSFLTSIWQGPCCMEHQQVYPVTVICSIPNCASPFSMYFHCGASCTGTGGGPNAGALLPVFSRLSICEIQKIVLNVQKLSICPRTSVLEPAGLHTSSPLCCSASLCVRCFASYLLCSTCWARAQCAVLCISCGLCSCLALVDFRRIPISTPPCRLPCGLCSN